jgi:dUTP pyrophosphatase
MYTGTPPQVGVIKLNPKAKFPEYAHDGDAGADLFADNHALLMPGGSLLIGTGLALTIPDGYVGLIHPRSGLAAKFKVTVLNAPGTIDSGYRGEIKVLLINHGSTNFLVSPGDKIAQIVFQEVARATFLDSDKFTATSRGENGFGSTGGHKEL